MKLKVLTITVKVLLKKRKGQRHVEFASVYFNSNTKTVINLEYDTDKSFQEILRKIDNWIDEGYGWVTESVDAEYVNVSIFNPLSGRTYIEFPCRWRNSILLGSA